MRFFLLIFLFSCGPEKADSMPSNPQEKLESKLDLYIELSLKSSDEKGWVDFSCDSVGFNSLLYAVLGGDNALASLDHTGRLWRKWQKTCLKEGKSKATISLDMVVLWLVYVQKHNKWGELNDFIDKMHASNGKIGDHDGSTDGLSRVHAYKTPQVVALAHHVKSQLGGNSSNWQRIDQDWSPKYSYPGHILAWRAWIYAHAKGGMPRKAIDALKKQVEWNENNGLYRAMLSRYDSGYTCPVDILLNEKYFPSDRLPESKDRCSDYLWQRDLGPDYEPCNKGKVHTGLDFIVAAAICTGRL